MAVMQLPDLITPDPSLRKRVKDLSGQNVSACFQCEKCTNGCPVSFAMDIAPHKVMRLVQLGLKDELLRSDTIWLCASCETCTARCPNGIDIAHVMDTLRQMSRRDGIRASQPDVPVFHDAFLASMKRHGRVHEASMVVEFLLRSKGIRGLLDYAGEGLDMMRKGKIRLLPSPLRANGQLRRIFSKAKEKAKG